MEKELLHLFFSGRASVEQERRLLDWLDQDPAHERELLAERRLFDAALMLARPAERPRRHLFALPRWTREAARYAAVIVAAAGLGGWYLSDLNERLMQSCNTIAVPAGQRVDVTLPDGTKVCMNALSELRYPTFFVGKQRRVQLSGEAFFDVTHDAKHPFVVETYACEVEVLGTKFDVEARSENDVFTASLVDGRVRVTDKTHPGSKVVLLPSDRVSRRDGQLVVDRLPDHEQFQWREGLIAFRDASFPELLAQFEKYYGVTFEVHRESVTDKLFTGKIRISEGVDHALRVLRRSAEFTHMRNEAKNVIYIR